MVIHGLFGDTKNNHLGLTPAIGASPNFSTAQKTLADSNKKITYWSDITVLQDDLKEPYNHFPIEMDKGLIRFLDLLLSHPHKGRSPELDDLPFGVWATEKQLWMALDAMYSNNMPEYYEAGTFSFHKSTHE